MTKTFNWLSGEQLLRISTNSILSLYIIKWLGPNNYAVYSEALLLATFVSVISKIGIQDYAVKNITESPRAISLFFSLRFYVGIFIYLTLTLITIASFQDKLTIASIVGIIAISQAFDIIEYNFLAKENGKYIAISKLIQNTLSIIVKLSIIHFNLNTTWLISTIALDSIFLSSVYFILSKKEIPNLHLQSANKHILILLKKVFPLAIASIITTASSRIDQIYIYLEYDKNIFGQYSAAVRLTEIWYFIVIAYTSAALPRIIKNIQNKSSNQNSLQRIYSKGLYGIILIPLTINSLPQEYLNRIIGAEYTETHAVLQNYSWICVAMLIYHLNTKWLIAMEKTIEVLHRGIIGLILSLTLVYFTHSTLGIYGISFSIALGILATELIYLSFNKHTRPIIITLIKSTNPKWIFK